MPKRDLFGVEQLREAVTLFNGCREGFNHLYSISQLILIYQAFKRSEWDIPPDKWTGDEIDAALRGHGTGATSDRY